MAYMNRQRALPQHIDAMRNAWGFQVPLCVMTTECKPHGKTSHPERTIPELLQLGVLRRHVGRPLTRARGGAQVILRWDPAGSVGRKGGGMYVCKALMCTFSGAQGQARLGLGKANEGSLPLIVYIYIYIRLLQ